MELEEVKRYAESLDWEATFIGSGILRKLKLEKGFTALIVSESDGTRNYIKAWAFNYWGDEVPFYPEELRQLLEK